MGEVCTLQTPRTPRWGRSNKAIRDSDLLGDYYCTVLRILRFDHSNPHSNPDLTRLHPLTPTPSQWELPKVRRRGEYEREVLLLCVCFCLATISIHLGCVGGGAGSGSSTP